MNDIDKLKMAFGVLDDVTAKSLENFTASSEIIAEYAEIERRQREKFIKSVQEAEFSCINGFYDKPLSISCEITSVDNEKEEKISSLKKRIKYCKNYMELKKLQQELNELYKDKKNSDVGASE